MPYKEKQMFFINFCLCGIAKLATRCMKYKRISAYFGKSCQNMVASTLISEQQIKQALFIRRNVHLAARYTPWDSSCLTRALVVKFWCQRYKLPYLFYIGLPRVCNQQTTIKAHAWITTGPIVITGGDCFDSHHVICSYSNVC